MFFDTYVVDGRKIASLSSMKFFIRIARLLNDDMVIIMVQRAAFPTNNNKLCTLQCTAYTSQGVEEVHFIKAERERERDPVRPSGQSVLFQYTLLALLRLGAVTYLNRKTCI